jgi:hypothetical protein
MTEQIEVKPKNKGGRPKGSTKAKKGALIWVQSDFVDSVQAFLETLKQQQQRQQVQQ